MSKTSARQKIRYRIRKKISGSASLPRLTVFRSNADIYAQLIDDANYIYNDKPLPQDLKTASIYDVIAAEKPDVQVDIWHSSKIVVQNNHIEHWLDNKKVLDIDRTSEAFKKGVLDSKFKGYQGFSTIPEGHILLQDHGHNVAFKNIKIKEL